MVANEIDHLDKEGFAAYPCIKALTRDIHRYQREKGHRKVPLIYSNKDWRAKKTYYVTMFFPEAMMSTFFPPDNLQDQGGRERQDIANYLTCELESGDDVLDAFGLNAYSWCDPATWRLQGLEINAINE